MRVILATMGSRGDVQPMQSLALGLMAAGHDALLCASPDFRESCETLGIAFHSVGSSASSMIKEFFRLFNEKPWKLAKMLTDVFKVEARSQFDDMAGIAQGADVLVCSSLQISGASIAEAAGVPYRYILYAPVLMRSRDYPPWHIPWCPSPGWVNRILWEIDRVVASALISNGLNARRRKMGLGRIGYVDSYVLGKRPLLAAEPDLCEVPNDVGRSVVQTGAFHLPVDGELPEDIVAFLDAGDPPVYVGFGSMVERDAECSTRMIVEAAKSLDRRVLIGSCWAGLGEGDLPDGCKAVGSVPHALLFPRVAAAVHHGGAGTTAAAARAGVPQVIVPHIADQAYWAHRVTTLGIGVRSVLGPRLTAERLTRAIDACLSDPATTDLAAKFGERLRKLDGVARAVDELKKG